MQVNSMNQMRHMYQTNQSGAAQGMQGQGGGPKGKGMGQVMQALPQDQREEISQALQNIPQEDRKSVVDQIKQLDVNNLSSDELYNSIMDILNPSTQTDVISATSINTYA